MQLNLKKGWLLSLGITATAGVGVSYVNIVFNSTTRWMILFAILTTFVMNDRLLKGMRGGGAIFGITLLVYGVLSTLWSVQPVLSGSKSAAYFLVAICYSAAGWLWAQSSLRSDIFSVLWPMALLVMISTIGGLGASGSTIQMNESIELYRGLTGNSNFLGIMVLISLPLPLWKIGHPETPKGTRRRYFFLLLYLLLVLISTVSRASLLAITILIAFFFLGLGVKRLAGGIFVVLALSTFLPIVFPEQTTKAVQRYVYKSNIEATSILTSRNSTWAASLEGAQEGGMFGLGFGVAYGETDYSFALSSSSYGREKANSFLAIIEELGLLGFFLFVGLILSIFSRVTSAIRCASRREDRLLLFILSGSLIAMLANAQFEAWLFSPGGVATPTFWATIGITTAVSFQVQRQGRLKQMPQAAACAQRTDRQQSPQRITRA